MNENPHEIIVACATDDGAHLVNRHFGDAPMYALYRLSRERSEYIKTVRQGMTEIEEDSHHGASEKARGIAGLLSPHVVQVLINHAFGPNIRHVVKRFVPVVVDSPAINEALAICRYRFDEISEAWAQGEERKHLVFRSSQKE